MAIKTALFLFMYLLTLGGSVFVHPLIGVCGYVMTYVVSPSTQWWGVPLAEAGVRYSFFMGIALALGLFLQSKKICFPGRLYFQEILFFLLIGWIFLTSYLGLPGDVIDNFAFKLFKVAVFLWILIRVVDSKKKYEIFLWTLILSSAYVGFDALGASTEQFGRIDRGVGGSDFSEGNFLATHFSIVLPYLAVFLFGGSIKRKIVLLISAVLLVNGIVLCRSRGVFVALVMGIVTVVFLAPKVWRKKIYLLVIVGMIGSYFLVDEGFVQRMGRINPDLSDIESQDDSAAGRIKAWQAAIEMVSDHPLGIGQGNFSRYVGQYQPDIPGKDTHNTYLRALAELGFPGLLLIMTLIFNAFIMLCRQKKRIVDHDLSIDLLLHVYAQRVALVIFLVSGMFITETYIEEFYWLLMLPVLLDRVVDTAQVSRPVEIPSIVT